MVTEKKDELVNEEDKPVTYSKKAQIVTITLVALLLVALALQTIHNFHATAEKQKQQDNKDKVNHVATIGPNQQSIDQFKEQQDRARLELESINKAKQEGARRDENLNNLANRTQTPASNEPTANGQKKVTEADIYENFNLAETERVLKARSASIASVKKSGAADTSDVMPVSNNGFSPAVYKQGASNAPDLDRVQNIIKDNNKIIDDMKKNSQRLLLAASDKDPAMYATMTGNAAVPSISPNSFGITANNRAIESPASPGVKTGEAILPIGTTISAVLQQDVISDYPNTWIAVLQRPVYDLNQENILLPTGSKIIGGTVRASDVNEVIQNRLGFFVTTLERGDGKRIDLKKMQGLDGAGIAGLSDQVDYHILARMAGVAAYAIVGLGPSTQDFGTKPLSATSNAVTDITAQSRQLGRSIAEKYLNIVPTVTIRAGTPIKIILQDDIYVTPWERLTAASYKYAE